MGYERKTILGAILCKFNENRSTFSQELKSDTWAPKVAVALDDLKACWQMMAMINSFWRCIIGFESSVKVFNFFSIFLNYQFF